MQVWLIENAPTELFADEADAPLCPDTAFVRYADHALVVYNCNQNLARVQRQRQVDQQERDALRNTLVALAPDLKVMAILYQQQGQSQRAQALMAIRESLGLGE